jgi:2-C-methyl-D-erythritol 2,4-cyclodiphosphate synthase
VGSAARLAATEARGLHRWRDETDVAEDVITPATRIGIGHDTHRLEPGGPLRLGGIEIPFEHSLIGHSDADVLLHAVTDALLGAAAQGDIGTWFPDDDPAHKGRDSAEMLVQVVEKIHQLGYRVSNVDMIVFAERPKLTIYKDQIRQRLARLLDIPLDCVGLKAKTGEQVGPVGRLEAIAAQCVVLIETS